MTRTPGRVGWTEAAVIAALRDWAQRYGAVPTEVDWDRAMARREGAADKLARLADHPTPIPTVSTVLARFGSWTTAVVAAGLEPRSVTRRLDAGAIRRTVALYESGLSTHQVAARLRIAPKTVRDRLHSSAVTLRPSRPRARLPPDPALDRAVLDAARAGATRREIAERLGVSSGRVDRVLARHALTGGSLVRQLRAQFERAGELDLTARERAVVELVVAQGRARHDVADRLGISESAIARDLKTIVLRLQRDE